MIVSCGRRWNWCKRSRKPRAVKTELRRFIRTIARAGQDSDVWPVAFLLFAVLVPTVCLLWFMGAAMRNERFAARQKLENIYRGQLTAAQARLEKHWDGIAAELQRSGEIGSPSAAFARCVASGK